MKEENTRQAVRNARRHLRFEICGLQRVFALFVVVSVAANCAMYAVMRRTQAQYTAELDTLEGKLQYAEHVKEMALEQYGGLVLELQRRSREAEERKQTREEPSYEYVGECKITYYCAEQYPHICGNGDGLTATGTPVEPGVVAVDPNVIELGSTVMIDGVEYLATDTGGAIKGYRVDVCVSGHQDALDMGTHTADVWIVR